jgi:hypothetical protein
MLHQFLVARLFKVAIRLVTVYSIPDILRLAQTEPQDNELIR